MQEKQSFKTNSKTITTLQLGPGTGIKITYSKQVMIEKMIFLKQASYFGNFY